MLFILLLILSACHRPWPKVIVLGVDGMDPGFVERHWDALPNLRALRDRGGFARLATTTPPQSPVAWSSFSTGLDPNAHGIFDFVLRDPKTKQPFSSMGATEEGRFRLTLGPYVLPLSRSRVVSFRRGTAFWQLLADRGIPVTVVRMPTNYPPVKAGRAISGMGTPDLRGTLGTFTFYTDDPEETGRAVSGGLFVKARVVNGRAGLELQGPPNSLRKNEPIATAPLIVDVDPAQPYARLTSGDSVAIVREGEWSPWMVADFPLMPLVSVRGTFRVYAKQLHPRFQIYVSPINVDPEAPSLPLSTPGSFARSVAEETGRFYTLGIPEDTSALRQGAFTLAEFLQQSRLVQDEEHRLLDYSLRHFKEGLLFFYVSSIDQNSHILWGRHDAELLDVYRRVDNEIGDVMRREPSADLMVMSDHGFTSFDRAVNLNTWLYARGFLALNGPPGDDTGLDAIDWRSAKAYALGLNGLYLADRALLKDVKQQLLAWQDPVNGRQVVQAVYETNPTPENAAVAPDLIVGYSPGYRASWQTGLGGTPRQLIEDNTDAWIADHCIDPAAVPGVLFTSWKTAKMKPRITDLAAWVMALFG